MEKDEKFEDFESFTNKENILKKIINKINTGILKGENLLPKKLLFVLILIFTMCCFKLCAEGMSPKEAQKAREDFVAEVKLHIGAPYVLGATGPDSFDCSGLVYYSAKKSLKVQLPRTARAIYKNCKIVKAEEREIGDLLFFKTNNSAPITHVGVYIGRNQFISALSDGPNTGVVVSSLNQSYWNPKYVATGKFLPKGIPTEEEKSEEEFGGEVARAGGVAAYSGSSYYNPNGKFLETFKDSLVLDTSVFADWSLFMPDKFYVNFRGIDITANIRMGNVVLEPGLGLSLRFNTGLKLFQLPMFLSITINDFVRFYAGPVFSFSTGTLQGTGEALKSSIFPGILGLSISTPNLKIGPVGIQLVQDISYTNFYKANQTSLNTLESISTGLVLYTGVRCSFRL